MIKRKYFLIVLEYIYCFKVTFCQIDLENQKKTCINKESAESGVAPAGIKSHKFLLVLKKIYFAVLKKLMG